MAFAREAVEAAGDQWAMIQPINALVARLEAKKVRKVSFDTTLNNHSLVWQIRVFEQVALHRVVSLANGCMAMWNARDIHGATLFAKEMIEITALVYDLAHRLTGLANGRDLEGARDLLADRTFGPKDTGQFAQASATRSRDLRRIIAKIDHDYPGTLETYDQLTHMCCPGTLGAFSMFVIIDKDTKDVGFDYFRHYSQSMFDRVVVACFLLGVFEHCLVDIQTTAQGLSTAIN